MGAGDGDIPLSPFSEEGRKALQTSLSSRQLADLLRSHMSGSVRPRLPLSTSMRPMPV